MIDSRPTNTSRYDTRIVPGKIELSLKPQRNSSEDNWKTRKYKCKYWSMKFRTDKVYMEEVWRKLKKFEFNKYQDGIQLKF